MSENSDADVEAEADVEVDADAEVEAHADGGSGPPEVTAEWPVDLVGVTESVVTTLGPNELWNVAALGLHAPEDEGDRVRARTWGRTRTWRNFTERGEGVVQFTPDPLDFAEAALTVREESEPVLDSADAWVRVAVEEVASGETGGTQWVDWHLYPTESVVVDGGVRVIDRAALAVVDATVAASRLDVPEYDTAALLERLAYFDSVVERCGGERARAAFDVVDAESGWREME
jgi:hypothetical protein